MASNTFFPRATPPWWKRILLPLTTVLITVVLFAIVLEVLATAYLYLREGTYVPARTRFESRTNTFVQQVVDGRDCGYVDTLFPHPYLAFVHHGNPPCGLTRINNIGLYGPDFESVRRTDRFVVLLTGGSVANQFGRGVAGGPSYLERMLNERYVSPNGQPFLVLNGADGAWKQPQQTIIFLLYADAVDAVITLDGFNEHYMVGSSFRFEYPANNFAMVNPLAAQQFGDVVAQWIVGEVRRWAADNALLARSQAAYSLISGAQDFLSARAAGREKPRTSIESMFLLPADWPIERRRDWAIEQYRKYVRAMQAIARSQGVRAAHFIQPAPALGKKLTPDEMRVVGNLGYREIYRRMTDDLLALAAENIPVSSLVDVFANESDTLYADPIHLRQAADNSSRGYQLMAERVAERLADAWQLTRRE